MWTNSGNWFDTVKNLDQYLLYLCFTCKGIVLCKLYKSHLIYLVPSLLDYEENIGDNINKTQKKTYTVEFETYLY